jgi:nucleoside-diphosphate-sugar epimerase
VLRACSRTPRLRGKVNSSPRSLRARNSGELSWQRLRSRSRARDGWRVRTTVRNLGRAEEVRATIGKIAANAGAIEFAAADLNSDTGWADAVGGADYVLHVASPVPTVDPKSDDELVRPARNGTLRLLKAAR